MIPTNLLLETLKLSQVCVLSFDKLRDNNESSIPWNSIKFSKMEFYYVSVLCKYTVWSQVTISMVRTETRSDYQCNIYSIRIDYQDRNVVSVCLVKSTCCFTVVYQVYDLYHTIGRKTGVTFQAQKASSTNSECDEFALCCIREIPLVFLCYLYWKENWQSSMIMLRSCKRFAV